MTAKQSIDMTIKGETMHLSTKTRREESRENQILKDKVAMRAYQKWLQAGCPHGFDQQFWRDAHAEVLAEISAKELPIAAEEPSREGSFFESLVLNLGANDAEVRENAMAKLGFFVDEALLLVIGAL